MFPWKYTEFQRQLRHKTRYTGIPWFTRYTAMLLVTCQWSFMKQLSCGFSIPEFFWNFWKWGFKRIFIVLFELQSIEINILVIIFKFIISDSPLLKNHRLFINLNTFENLWAFCRFLFISEDAISFHDNT